MPREFRHALDDMLAAFEGIQHAAHGRTEADYSRDWLLKHGIQRGIEIISEASRALPDDLLAQVPDIPWPRVRAIGNILRHEYHHLFDRIIWLLVVDEIPRLHTAVVKLLSEGSPASE